MCRWFVFFFETGEVPSTKLRRGQTRVSAMLLQRKVIHSTGSQLLAIVLLQRRVIYSTGSQLGAIVLVQRKVIHSCSSGGSQ